jgi:hypothetical protein
MLGCRYPSASRQSPKGQIGHQLDRLNALRQHARRLGLHCAGASPGRGPYENKQKIALRHKMINSAALMNLIIAQV